MPSRAVFDIVVVIFLISLHCLIGGRECASKHFKLLLLNIWMEVQTVNKRHLREIGSKQLAHQTILLLVLTLS